MRTIVFKGEPKSTQHLYRASSRGGFFYMTTEGKVLKNTYQWEAKTQWKGGPLAGNVDMTIRFFFKDRRKRDLDNQNKLVLDSLSGIAYVDDSQINALHLHREHDPKSPRIEITLKGLGVLQ